MGSNTEGEANGSNETNSKEKNAEFTKKKRRRRASEDNRGNVPASLGSDKADSLPPPNGTASREANYILTLQPPNPIRAEKSGGSPKLKNSTQKESPSTPSILANVINAGVNIINGVLRSEKKGAKSEEKDKKNKSTELGKSSAGTPIPSAFHPTDKTSQSSQHVHIDSMPTHINGVATPLSIPTTTATTSVPPSLTQPSPSRFPDLHVQVPPSGSPPTLTSSPARARYNSNNLSQLMLQRRASLRGSPLSHSTASFAPDWRLPVDNWHTEVDEIEEEENKEDLSELANDTQGITSRGSQKETEDGANKVQEGSPVVFKRSVSPVTPPIPKASPKTESSTKKSPSSDSAPATPILQSSPSARKLATSAVGSVKVCVPQICAILTYFRCPCYN